MKRFFYIFPLLCVLLFSCKDDLTVNPDIIEDFEGSSALSISIDIPDTRTRAIDMTPGAGVYLNKVWVGIYRQSDGKRVGGTDIINNGQETDLNNRLTASGSKLYNVIEIKGYENTVSTSDNLIVVGIANYDDDIKAYYFDNENKTPRKYSTLFDALKAATSWNLFKEIAIDTQNSTFKDQTPILMGYLYKDNERDESDAYVYTKVNQFVSGNAINLYPFGSDTNYSTNDIYVHATANGTITKINSKGFFLKLRRLRSKMNIVINTAEGVSVTNAQYKVFNKPNSAFLAQRRTNILSGYSVSDPTSVEYSPNSADIYTGEGYSNDDNWNSVRDNYNFSFEHFENKHWAYQNKEIGSGNNVTDRYHLREKKNSNGAYVALVGESGQLTDWNNNASYFVLKLNIRDTNTGRNGEVEYTIHEGFCNDKDGVQYQRNNNGTVITDSDGNPLLLSLSDRLKDFSCVRNTDYYYYVTINGIDDIRVQVVENSDEHQYDQIGSIYQFNYITNERGVNYINATEDQCIWVKNSEIREDLLDSSNQNLHFSSSDEKELQLETPILAKDNVAFRFVHAVGNDSKVDVCYNFARGELDGFAGLWQTPGDKTEYLVTTDNYGADYYLEQYSNSEFDDLIEKIKILPAGKISFNDDAIDIKQYIKNIHDEENQNPDIAGFWVKGEKNYRVNPDGNELRALYIFDKQWAIPDGYNVMSDKENAFHKGSNDYCKFYQINGIEQYLYLDKENFEIVYPKGYSKDKRIPYNGQGIYYELENPTLNGSYLALSDDPDIGIRIIGCYEESSWGGWNKTQYHSRDYCFNFSMNDYPEFADFWPATTNYTTNNINNINNIPSEILNGFTINYAGTDYTVQNFINNIKTLPKSGILQFKVNNTYSHNQVTAGNDPADHIRAIYIFDKKNLNVSENKKPAILSSDGLTATYQVYACEQYPDYDPLIPLSFDKTNMIWHDDYHKLAETDLWCGAINSAVEIKFKHVEGISGYKLQVGWHSPITIEGEDLTNYISSKDDDLIFTYLYPTTNLSIGSYNVYITPIVDESIYHALSPINLTNAVKLYNTSWDFSKSPWSNLKTSDLNGTTSNNSIEYQGLELVLANNNEPKSVTPYICFGGGGNSSRRYFRFYASKSGRLTINACTNSGSGSWTQPFIIFNENNNTETQFPVYIYEKGNPQNVTIELNISEPSFIKIYNNSDIFWYSITYTAY